MSFLYENGWVLFILSEGLTWLFGLLFLISRYRFRLDHLSQWCLLVIILCTIFQALLAGINYYFTGRVSVFQVVIILFIIYAATLGSSDFKRLDSYIQQKTKKYRQLKDAPLHNDDIFSYAKYRQQLFFLHTIALIVIHLVWFALDFNTSGSLTDYRLFFLSDWLQHPHQGFFNNPTFNIISYLWSIFYIIDLYIFLTYTFLLYFSHIKNTT
ncbi:hypothetical protein ACFFHM_21340 [Halalkalibacter kiskunsagensis]|uniref:Integral membrane protein n=1 Tax=Halalkalibacter kiskunsagensis TaxID=1548599 RepID=A0ABV6KLV3_9BACI